MTDIEEFLSEIMIFLTEEDVLELEDKAGVKFPIADPDWEDLCYVCAWMGLKRDLPGSIHNRMVLGKSNDWTRIYAASRSSRVKTVPPDDLWDLAS